MSVAVPVAFAGESPAVIVLGAIARAVMAGGFTVSVACLVTDPCVAVNVTVLGAGDCRFVEIVKPALVPPVWIVTGETLG